MCEKPQFPFPIIESKELDDNIVFLTPFIKIPSNFDFEKFRKEMGKIRFGDLKCKIFKPNKKIKELK